MILDNALAAMSEYSKRPKPATEEEAEIYAYETWAVSELYFRVTDHPFSNPEEVIYQFCMDMAELTGMESMKDRKIDPFIVAYDVGISLLRMIDHPRED